MLNTQITKEILFAHLEGGGELINLPNELQEQVHGKQSKISRENLIIAVNNIEDAAALSFVLDHLIWYSLPWEVGDAIFQRLFYLGRRDEKFLGTCMSYYNYSGPEGDLRLLEFMDQLDEEGKSELKKHLDPELVLTKKYRSSDQP